MPLQFLSPIHKASRQIGVYLEGQLTTDGLTAAEGHLVSYLRGYGPCRVGELHRVFGFKRSTLTSILDRLSARGLIHRRTPEQDRRSVLVDVTPLGCRVGDAIQEQLEALEEKIGGRISAGDLEGFRAVMGAIAVITQVNLRSEEER